MDTWDVQVEKDFSKKVLTHGRVKSMCKEGKEKYVGDSQTIALLCRLRGKAVAKHHSDSCQD